MAADPIYVAHMGSIATFLVSRDGWSWSCGNYARGTADTFERAATAARAAIEKQMKQLNGARPTR